MPTLLRLCTLLAIAFSSLALAACDGQTPPEPTRSTVGSLTVTSVDDLAWPSPNNFSISPDGTRLATYDSGELCISDFAGSKQVCAHFADAMRGTSVAVDFISWSPDDTRIAFTEDSFVGNESDIWVMDISSGKLTNLTDDKLTQRQGTSTSKALRDLLPHWTKDGTQIGFVRDLGLVVEDIDKPSEVYILNAEGSDSSPQKIANLPGSTIFPVFAWSLSPDEKVVAYFTYASEKKSVRVLDVGTKEEKGLPYDNDLITTLTFSGDGRYLLGYDSKSAYYLTWDKPGSRLWRVDDGVEETSWGTAHYATWSPDGSGLAYLLLDSATAGAKKPGLYLSDGPGKPGKLVYEGQFLSPTAYSPLTWATDNTILLANMDKNKLLRLHLGTK